MTFGTDVLSTVLLQHKMSAVILTSLRYVQDCGLHRHMLDVAKMLAVLT